MSNFIEVAQWEITGWLEKKCWLCLRQNAVFRCVGDWLFLTDFFAIDRHHLWVFLLLSEAQFPVPYLCILCVQPIQVTRPQPYWYFDSRISDTWLLLSTFRPLLLAIHYVVKFFIFILWMPILHFLLSFSSISSCIFTSNRLTISIEFLGLNFVSLVCCFYRKVICLSVRGCQSREELL